MTTNLDTVLPSAQDYVRKLEIAEAEKAKHALEQDKAAEEEKKALIKHLSQPSGISDEEAIQRGVKIIERAVHNGLKEVQVYRFPKELCTDNGRAINQGEQGWEKTLTGVPLEIYNLWHKYFQPRGYKLLVEIVDYPGGMPGDVGMTLKWA